MLLLCSKCGKEKEDTEFYPYRLTICKECNREANRKRLEDPEVKAKKNAQMRKRWADDPEYREHHYSWRRNKYNTDPEFKEKQKSSKTPFSELTEEQKERKRANDRKSQSRPEFKFRRKTYNAERNRLPEVKAKKSAQNKQRRSSDLIFRLAANLRCRLSSALKGRTKSGSSVDDLGCSVEELKSYLESKFKPGMTWDNWGNTDGCWSVDHIIPLSAFDLNNRQHLILACNYMNLQPLWHLDNISKGNKYPEDLSK